MPRIYDVSVPVRHGGVVYPGNPAYIYGLGVLEDGRPAPVDPRFLRLRTAAGRYDSGTAAQVGVPFQMQLGLRLQF